MPTTLPEPTALSPTLVRLFDAGASVRRAAVEALELGPLSHLYALREALLADEDAEVRAGAAPRLAEAGDERATPWLLEALEDSRPSVREAAWRALAKLSARELLGPAGAALRSEEVWWVRRAAMRAVATVGGDDALALLVAALDDPFWRARYAAMQALAVDCARRGEARRAVEAALASPSEVVRRSAEWILGAMDVAPEGRAAARPAVEDEDPAVTAARLEEGRWTPSSAELVALLGDPHESLRRAAKRRLLRAGGLAEARLLLRWLDEPRVPSAAKTARDVLSQLAFDPLTLAREVLAPLAADPNAASLGRVAWAAQVVASRGEPHELERLLATSRKELHEAEQGQGASRSEDRPRTSPHTNWDPPSPPGQTAPAQGAPAALPSHGRAFRRVLATALAETGAGAALAAHDDPALFEPAYQWWLSHPATAAPVTTAGEVKGSGVVSRRLRAALAARPNGSGPIDPADEALARAATVDSDPQVRALAWAGLPDRARAAEDEDPWVRLVALDLARAPGVLLTDPDLPLRRAALSLLVRERHEVAPALRDALSAALCAQADPELRAGAALVLCPQDVPAALPRLLALTEAGTPMVRSAAAASLESCPGLDAHLERLLSGPLTSTERRAAYTWLLRAGDDAAFQRLARALDAEPKEVVSHLEAMVLVFPDEVTAQRPDVRRRAPVVASPGPRPAPTVRDPHPSWRPLGRTGLVVSPLVLSGAHEPAPAGLAKAVDAGVSTFFWEPEHVALTQFLRGSRDRSARLVLVAGSYESGPAAIRADVERALRALRRETLDVFLLFWARSAARLDDRNFQALDRLRAEGLVRTFGFSTHLRDLARDALTAHPWPVVMTRHSAAHPGPERGLLAAAEAVGAGVLAFTATCYGRLLQRVPGTPEDFQLPDAGECYRYVLSQPGVSAVLSAPRRPRELDENLEVLARPTLGVTRLEALRAHGERVRGLNARFNALVRGPPDASRPLPELFDEPTPDR